MKFKGMGKPRAAGHRTKHRCGARKARSGAAPEAGCAARARVRPKVRCGGPCATDNPGEQRVGPVRYVASPLPSRLPTSSPVQPA